MPAPTYLDFDLQITPGANGYRARVLASPAGEAAEEFELPFSNDEISEFGMQLLQSSNRQSSLFEKGILRAVGGQLFEAIFHGELYACLSRSLDEASRQHAGLRLRLRLSDAPALANLPWEYLYHAAGNRYLALSTSSPLVHYLELPQPVQPLTITPPVGILGLISGPSDLPQLDGEKEWNNLKGALDKLSGDGQIKLVRLQNPTLFELQRVLRQEELHVIHFVGHALYDEANGEGRVALCDANGAAELVSGQQLAQLLHNEPSLRLVVLNACEGSRTSIVDPFAGVAQTLVQQGAPAVIAMQFAITDQAAITFCAEFYAALADGYPVDAALTEARVAISTRQRGGEWGTPKLFMRAGDGLLWRLSGERHEQSASETLSVLPGLMERGEVRRLVATFRTNFQAASQQIDLLVEYKDLHDLLHKLQFRCYNVILQEAPRFPADDLALDNLLNYEVTLQDIVLDLGNVAERGVIPASELSWIDDVDRAAKKLHEAVTRVDPDALKQTIWLLKRIIALQPSSINQRLNAAARALRLDALVEALTMIDTTLHDLHVEPDKVAQFTAGVEALRSLDVRLMKLVEAHDNWQALERMLSRIEDVIVYDVNELTFSWPDVQAKVVTLSQEATGDWARLLSEDGNQLDGAITGQNPSLIQRYFRRYRQRAGNRFYQVDVALKNLCEELRQVGEPLASVLRIIE